MEEELERCRLCLAEDILKPDIFQSKDDDGVAAFTKIMLCTSLAVTPEDSYSKFICQQCSNMIELFFNFRNNCFKTHIMMYNTLQVMSQDDPGFVFELSGNGVKVVSEREKCVKEEPAEQIITEDDIEDITIEDTTKYSTSERTYQGRQHQVEELEMDKEEARRLKCLLCRRVFEGVSELDAHWPECQAQVETQAHQTKGKEFTCQECGQTFKQLLLLRRHVQVKHIKTRPFACRLCPRRFYDQYELKYHGRLHEDTEDFVCTECGRRFSRKSGLKAHLRSHTGERPYKCAHCPRSFSHPTSLSSHLRVHTGERPYQCRYCEKKFAQYSTAKSHEEMHKGGERMHQCAVCHRMFRTELELKIHEKLHPRNDGGSLCCSLCPRTYTLRASLKRHLIKSHPRQIAKEEFGAAGS